MFKKWKQRIIKRFKGKNNNLSTSVTGESNNVNTFASPRPQNFSLPNSIIHYISKSPQNPEGYKKLIKTCKYFTSKNHIVPIIGLMYYPPNFNLYDNDDGTLIYLELGHAYENIEFTGAPKHIDHNEINYKLWLTGKLSVSHPEILNSLIPKIYRCNLKNLLLNNQNLNYSEFMILVSSGTIEWLSLGNTIIVKYENNETNENGKIMPLEEIIECLPKLKELSYVCADSNSITSETADKLIVIPHIVNLETIQLENIPETFEFETFLNFSKKFLKTGGTFYFREPLSNYYKCRLQTYINDILAEGLQENPPPIIQFPGQSRASFDTLQNLFQAFKERESQASNNIYKGGTGILSMRPFTNSLQKLGNANRSKFSMYSRR